MQRFSDNEIRRIKTKLHETLCKMIYTVIVLIIETTIAVTITIRNGYGQRSGPSSAKII